MHALVGIIKWLGATITESEARNKVLVFVGSIHAMGWPAAVLVLNCGSIHAMTAMFVLGMLSDRFL